MQVISTAVPLWTNVHSGYIAIISTQSTVTSSDLSQYDSDIEVAMNSLTLSQACIDKLSPSQIENMKENVVVANQGYDTVGIAIRETMAALYRIKRDVKNKNWTALTDSGVLHMSGRTARDLVKAYETWVRDSDVPNSALARVSARMQARIGSVEAGKRTHAINKIKKGEGYTEQDIAKIISNTKSPVRRQIDDLVAQAEKEIKATTNEDKINEFAKLKIENVNLEGKVEKQKEIISELQNEIKKLGNRNKELTKMLYQAATEGVSPASAKEAAAALI